LIQSPAISSASALFAYVYTGFDLSGFELYLLTRLASMQLAMALVAHIQQIKLIVNFAPPAIDNMMRFGSWTNAAPFANAV
jgi:hypothetical protein